MTSTPPADTRKHPDLVADERTSLEQWLDFHRETLAWKCEGLSHEQLAQKSVPTSGLTLLGLVRHMTGVEQWWFRMHGAGETVEFEYFTDESPNDDFDDLDSVPAKQVLSRFREECELSRRAVADKTLDEQVTCTGHEHKSNTRDIRWIYLHMIEEYARHNGHADLLREAIDGATGD